MNTRIASAIAAVVLSVSAIASPALAQGRAAPAGATAVTAPVGVGNRNYDEITTGSIGYGSERSSAQEGNAEENSFPIWQYGRTSGGTAR